MNGKDNGVNEVSISYSIAELGLIASAMHSSACEAMVRTGGKNAKTRYLEMSERASKICPLPLHGGREYGWFDGFTALETAKSYFVYLDFQPQTNHDGGDDESLQLALIADGRRFNLTDRLGRDRTDATVRVTEEHQKMLAATEELARRAAPMDAEFNSTLQFTVETPNVERGFKTSLSQDRRKLISKEIAQKIGISAEEKDFYILSVRADGKAKSYRAYEIIVSAPQERLDQIKAAYGLEPPLAMTL